MFIQLTIARCFVYFCVYVCVHIFLLNVFFVPDRSVFEQAYLLGFFQYNVHQKMSFDQSQTIIFFSFFCARLFLKNTCAWLACHSADVYTMAMRVDSFSIFAVRFFFLRLCQLLLVNKYLMSSKHIK